MNSLKVLKNRYTFPEAVERAVDFRPPIVRGDRQLFTEYAQAADRYTQISSGLKTVCRNFLDFEITPPPLDAFEAAVAALPYSDTRELMQHRIRQAISALAEALDIPQLGRVTWADRESCRFTYFEVQRDRGILRNTVRRIAHQHDVVKARQHKLPATDVVIPKRGLEIISAIPAPLKRYTRVITGLEVRQQAREDSSREESTWLAQALARGKHQLTQAKTAAAVGIVGAGAALASGFTALLSAVTAPVAIADPAIVIGEICLYGWEN
jgi:hypothetical protein